MYSENNEQLKLCNLVEDRYSETLCTTENLHFSIRWT